MHKNLLKYVKGAIVSGVTLGAMFVIYNLYAPYGLVSQSAERSLEVRGNFPRALIVSNNRRLQSELESETKKAKEVAIKVLKADPLNDEAIVQYALALEKENSNQEIYDYLVLAKSRNGRNLKAASYLLREEVESGDLNAAIRELNLLFKLNQKGAGVYDTLLDGVWETPRGKAAVLDIIKTAPRWGEAFVFRQLNNMGPEKASSIEMLIDSFEGTEYQKRRMQAAFLNQLIHFKLFDKAHGLWALNLEEAIQTGINGEGRNLVFNSNFQNLGIGFGFDWIFTSTKKVSTEYLLNEGLFVGFNVNSPQKVIRQVVPTPKDARLIFEHETTYAGYRGGGVLEWTIRCAETHQTLLRVKASTDNKGGKRTAFDTGNCRYAVVELQALPGTFSRRVSANVISAKITRE